MLKRIKDILGLTTLPDDQIRINRNKIEWDHFFLCEAYLISLRSHDPQTQCGCVLVRDKTVISGGYNGFISGIDDTALPNLRPYKYPFMIHSEQNAIFNAARNGVSTLGATAYITGEPCNNCLQYMWQAGIARIVFSDFNKIAMLDNEEHRKTQSALLYLMNERMPTICIPSEEIPIKIVDKTN